MENFVISKYPTPKKWLKLHAVALMQAIYGNTGFGWVMYGNCRRHDASFIIFIIILIDSLQNLPTARIMKVLFNAHYLTPVKW